MVMVKQLPMLFYALSYGLKLAFDYGVVFYIIPNADLKYLLLLFVSLFVY